MKKIFLFFLLTAAVITFCFFSTIMMMILGLCCILLGLISIFNPAIMKFKKILNLTWVRTLGGLFLIIGLVLTYSGTDLTYELYLKPGGNDPFASSVTAENPETTGSGAVRPKSNPYPYLANTKSAKSTEENKTQTRISGILQNIFNTSSTNQTNQTGSTTTSPTEPQPSTQSPQEKTPSINSHRGDPPKKGEQGDLKSNRKNN